MSDWYSLDLLAVKLLLEYIHIKEDGINITKANENTLKRSVNNINFK